MVEKYMPDIYQKSIYYINYDKLFKKGIRCILFDLDNTISPPHVNKATKRLIKLFDELKDIGFKIIIISNSPKHRIEPFKNYLNVDACAFAIKPRRNKYERVMDKFKFKSTEIAAVGDQLLTDIYGANKLDITSILVNPLTPHDYSITFFNRLFEKVIYNKLAKKDLLIRGKYYE